MSRLVLLAAIGSAAVVAQSFVVLADEVPSYDSKKVCKADLQAEGDASGQAGAACLSDEQDARATLKSRWMQYSSASKQECVQLQSNGSGPQSYVELLTCLQMAKDAKGLPKD
jgi:hypothetical protein